MSTSPNVSPAIPQGRSWNVAFGNQTHRVMVQHNKNGLPIKIFVDDWLMYQQAAAGIVRDADIPVQFGPHQFVVSIRDNPTGSDYYLTVNGVLMDDRGPAMPVAEAPVAAVPTAPVAAAPVAAVASNAPPGQWLRRRRQPLGPSRLIGLLLLIASSAGTALSINGFGPRLPLNFVTGFLLSIIGGVVGGALYWPRPRVAGILGGLVGAPAAFIAVYLESHGRLAVWRAEIVIVGCLACLPGIGVGWLLTKMFGPRERV